MTWIKRGCSSTFLCFVSEDDDEESEDEDDDDLPFLGFFSLRSSFLSSMASIDGFLEGLGQQRLEAGSRIVVPLSTLAGNKQHLALDGIHGIRKELRSQWRTRRMHCKVTSFRLQGCEYNFST